MSTKTYDPFDGAVCQTLRNLVSAQKRAIAKRDNLFGARDAIKAEIDQTSSGEKEKRDRLHAEYGETVIQIDQYKRAITRITADIHETVENADNSKLFKDPAVDMSEYLGDEPKVDPKAGAKPVGGPSATKPPAKPKGPPPEPAPQIEGVNEHLAASVNELDLRENLKGALLNAGFNTVGDINKFIDDKGDLVERLNVGQAKAGEVKAAVKAYLKTHLSAQMKADGITKP